jgi:hypothetical protein
MGPESRRDSATLDCRQVFPIDVGNRKSENGHKLDAFSELILPLPFQNELATLLLSSVQIV